MFNAVVFILLVERLWQMSVEAEVGGRYQHMVDGAKVVKSPGNIIRYQYVTGIKKSHD